MFSCCRKIREKIDKAITWIGRREKYQIGYNRAMAMQVRRLRRQVEALEDRVRDLENIDKILRK